MTEICIRHMNAIAEYFGGWKQEPDYEYIMFRWYQYTKSIERYATIMCNTGLDVNQKRLLEMEVDQILSGLTTMFQNEDKIREKVYFNYDPRGYGLKIKLDGHPNGIYTDWGGYGIFCPYDGVDGKNYRPYHTITD